MNIIVFFKKYEANHKIFEFCIPDMQRKRFSASNLNDGYEMANQIILHYLKNNLLIQTTCIDDYLHSINFKDYKFFIVHIDSNYNYDKIEKVTITLPNRVISKIEKAIFDNPTFKSRSALILKAVEELLLKENKKMLLSAVQINSKYELKDLSIENPIYFKVKFARLYYFIEFNKKINKNFLEFTIHNLGFEEFRSYHGYGCLPFGDTDRISLKNQDEIDEFLKIFEEEFKIRGYEIQIIENTEINTRKYTLVKISWNSQYAKDFLNTNIDPNKYIFEDDFILDYLKSIGVEINI